MEGNYGLENQPAPAGSEVTEFCANELTRSNSDLPTLIADKYADILRGSANATPLDRGLDDENKGDSSSAKGRKNDFLMDNCKAWTNEKHSLYLNHLEVSFVKQLNQSMGCISQKRPSSVHNASEQFSILWRDCWQKINYERGQPLLHTSTDSHDTLKSPWIYGSRQTRKQCPLPSADIQESLKLQNADKHTTRKRVSSQGLATYSQQLLASNLYHGDSLEFLTEGTGQNFVDEGGQNNHPNISSQAKRLKRALVDSSDHDQIVPLWEMSYSRQFSC
ncbi:cold regulated protein 27 [Abeliophyllum distichum]|uniref:Cold regulated protein 27 n=1 Tax=Abeliophyllum distichum TaxID=126358 RepID=A0ABD1P8P0_9LAMI